MMYFSWILTTAVDFTWLHRRRLTLNDTIGCGRNGASNDRAHSKQACKERKLNSLHVARSGNCTE